MSQNTDLIMLTRHFYELEEVPYALRHALRFGKVREAVFWAHELILSQEFEVLHKTMITSWLMFLGPSYIHWFDAWLSVGSDIGGCERLVLVAEFAKWRDGVMGRVLEPCSTFIIAGRGLAEAQDMDKVSDGVGANDAFAVYRYLALGPALLISTLCEMVDSPEIFDSLKKAIGSGKGPLKLLLSVAAVQVLCLVSHPDVLTPTMGPFVAGLLETWEPLIGRHVGRCFSIDDNCLPRRYKRAVTLVGQPLSIVETGSLFWRELAVLLNDVGGKAALVAEYFPDGNPDTWPDRTTVSEKAVLGLIKTDMRMNLIWNFRPALRKEWAKKIDLLLKACDAPDR